MGKLTPHRVEDDSDVEAVRMIRNACRAGFAHFTGEISRDQQAAWWEAGAGRLIGYLYTTSRREVVGYGLLRQTDDGRWWSSVAVLPSHAGRGYGGAITAHVIRCAPGGVVYAEARLDNPAAVALHRAEDWARTGEADGLAHFVTRSDILTRPAREDIGGGA